MLLTKIQGNSSTNTLNSNYSNIKVLAIEELEPTVTY